MLSIYQSVYYMINVPKQLISSHLVLRTANSLSFVNFTSSPSLSSVAKFSPSFSSLSCLLWYSPLFSPNSGLFPKLQITYSMNGQQVSETQYSLFIFSDLRKQQIPSFGCSGQKKKNNNIILIFFFSLCFFFVCVCVFSILHLIRQHTLMSLLLKCIQHLSTCPHLHSHHTGLSHFHISP